MHAMHTSFGSWIRASNRLRTYWRWHSYWMIEQAFAFNWLHSDQTNLSERHRLKIFVECWQWWKELRGEKRNDRDRKNEENAKKWIGMLCSSCESIMYSSAFNREDTPLDGAQGTRRIGNIVLSVNVALLLLLRYERVTLSSVCLFAVITKTNNAISALAARFRCTCAHNVEWHLGNFTQFLCRWEFLTQYYWGKRIKSIWRGR